MLIASKNKNEKIVLGLLSYTYEENLSPQELKEKFQAYRDNEKVEIYLYRQQEGDNYLGVMVVETLPEFENSNRPRLSIERVGIIPSFRHEGNGYEMYLKLRERFPNAVIQGNLLMSEIVKDWTIRYREEFEQIR